MHFNLIKHASVDHPKHGGIQVFGNMLKLDFTSKVDITGAELILNVAEYDKHEDPPTKESGLRTTYVEKKTGGE